MSHSFTEKLDNPKYSGVTDVTPLEVKDNLSNIILFDVREPDEFVGELGHIQGSTLLPLGSLEEKFSDIPKDNTVVFICRSGNRSGKAALMAKENGYTDVFNMLGGMLLWNEKGFETTTES